MNTAETRLRKDAFSIFSAALDRVDPRKMIEKCCALKSGIFSIRTENESRSYDLSKYGNIYVIGAGKAGAKMALAVESILGDFLTEGVVAVKYGHTESLSRIALIEAGHPVPDENSIKAAEELLRISDKAGENDLVINLISGGGSAILTAPLQAGKSRLTLKDLQILTGELLACGADIREINCIRKHLSRIKGGRLAEKIAPAQSVSLILSDVVGDSFEVIASGPTVPDSTTYEDVYRILKRYNLWKRVPKGVRAIVSGGLEGRLPDTPGPGDPLFKTTDTLLIGTNSFAVCAAAEKAEALGYRTMVLGSRITGESREVARVYAGIAKDATSCGPGRSLPLCVIGGGETTVTLRGNGKGGRNQEMALSFLNEYMTEPDLLKNVCFLSGGTDGNDGPTDAAGGVVSYAALSAAAEAGIRPSDYIENSDSYSFLSETDSLLMTGPTNTNVCDIQILLRSSP